MRAVLAFAAGLALAGTAYAADLSAPQWTLAPPAKPTALSETDRAAWRRVFASLRAREWAAAQAQLDVLPAGPLTPLARAELLLGAAVDGAGAATLASSSPDLPEAPGLVRLARGQGLGDALILPQQQALVRAAGPSKRAAARPVRGDLVGARLTTRVTPLFKANDGVAAETLIEAAADTLAPDTLTELRQRTAWAYFLGGDDASAQRVATLAQGGTGDWAVQAAWVAGLAGWRLGDYAAAGPAFAKVAEQARDSETIAAGLFWAARCDTAVGDATSAASRLRSAARMGETFYGLLAEAALGGIGPIQTEVAPIVLDRTNVRAAAALVEIGENALADQLLRHQARIGPVAEHGALIRTAGQLGLPATQLWLAQNVPAGSAVAADARYPMPAWSPAGGWRVDSALLYAHALQESQFRLGAVSPAGARGLMQLMPGTVRMVARHLGKTAPATLDDPATSLEYGQSYLEELADNAGTGGLLPKVIAAYNAGPNNVALWNLRPKVQADPLLFIEAIPFAETRAYVAIVLRNYWMYQRQSGTETVSLTALAGGQWPRFPTRVVRMAAGGGDMTANR